MPKDTAEVPNDKPVPSRRQGALRQAMQQNQKSPERHNPKEKGTVSSPKAADEQDCQAEAWTMRKYYG